jgi:hypothetical protein
VQEKGFTVRAEVPVPRETGSHQAPIGGPREEELVPSLSDSGRLIHYTKGRARIPENRRRPSSRKNSVTFGMFYNVMLLTS